MADGLTKEIYFPREKTSGDESKRLELSLSPSEEGQQAYTSYLRRLSSRQIRYIVGDPTWDSLSNEAEQEGISNSELVKYRLRKHFQSLGGVSSAGGEAAQMSLFETESEQDGAEVESESELGVTYRDTKSLPIHRWYPYIEGFSADYVRNRILNCEPLPQTVYDPFGGCGTAMLEASRLRIQSFFSEVNPFMKFVAETKVNCCRWVKENEDLFENVVEEFKDRLKGKSFEREKQEVSLSGYHEAFPDRDYFQEEHLKSLVLAKEKAEEVAEGVEEARNLLLLCVASQTVESSKMTRRADLRRRREDEYKNRVVDVPLMILNHLDKMVEDIGSIKRGLSNTKFVNKDARKKVEKYKDSIDLAITSPPYLNGTNYFRNTKMELWLLGYLDHESDLKGYRDSAIAAGINNVAKRRGEPKSFDFVEEVATELDDKANDKRIPRLVRLYFSDMGPVMENVYNMLRSGGKFIVDIGDSQFYGVHVPTDELLSKLAERKGFEVEERNIIAKRRSRDSTPLHQAEIILSKPGERLYAIDGQGTSIQEKPVVERSDDQIEEDASWLEANLPHKSEPYSKRGWGQKLHSLCSYQGKMKPALAHWLVKSFTGHGDIVLDPLGGVGTIAFEAALQGRPSITNDLSPFASTVASGKVRPPLKEEAYQMLDELESRLGSVELTEEDFQSAEFGLNDSVKEYYHDKTLKEVLRARRYFMEKERLGDIEKFLKASILHILHGNRPYALSRRSHPVTPFSPKGEFEYRPLIDRVKNRIDLALKESLPSSFVKGKSYSVNYRVLPEVVSEEVDCIITSPPFMGMRFDRPNWLRLWFCGWSEEDFHETSKQFLERQQKKSLDVYESFFETCSSLLRDEGLLVLHLGNSDEHDMVPELKKMGSSQMNFLRLVSENVQNVASHGIEDKGLTSDHVLLFFRP